MHVQELLDNNNNITGVTVSQAGLREEAKASPYAKSATILWPESFMAASPRCFPYTTACLLDELVLGLCYAGHGGWSLVCQVN